MNVDKFEEIKEKINILEKKRNKAEGSLDTIKKELSKMDCNSVEEAREELEKLKTDKEKFQTRFDKVSDKLEKAYDWDSIEEE